MLVNFENYESMTNKMSEKWLRFKDQNAVEEVLDYEFNYHENQVLNILGRIHCLKNSLK